MLITCCDEAAVSGSQPDNLFKLARILKIE
jgi:hypothetical protein